MSAIAFCIDIIMNSVFIKLEYVLLVDSNNIFTFFSSIDFLMALVKDHLL